MLTCMFCPATFETRPIETGFTPGAKLDAALAALAKQDEEGGRWEPVRVTVGRAGGQQEVLVGSTCPDHQLQAGAVTLQRQG